MPREALIVTQSRLLDLSFEPSSYNISWLTRILSVPSLVKLPACGLGDFKRLPTYLQLQLPFSSLQEKYQDEADYFFLAVEIHFQRCNLFLEFE